jgi:hypothetical protein
MKGAVDCRPRPVRYAVIAVNLRFWNIFSLVLGCIKVQFHYTIPKSIGFSSLYLVIPCALLRTGQQELMIHPRSASGVRQLPRRIVNAAWEGPVREPEGPHVDYRSDAGHLHRLGPGYRNEK